jgi:carboxyl-terminal processing protease
LHGRFRALFAALLVAIASLGGAIFLAHARADQADSALVDRASAPLDLRALLAGAGGSDQHLLDLAFTKVEDVYYKPVTAQLLLNGEQQKMAAYLKAHGIRNPQIPKFVATGDRMRDGRLLDKNLELAESLYGKRVSPTELTQAAVSGMLDSLGDPYTTYLSADEINGLEESLRGGDFGGIGVYIIQDPRTKSVLVDPIEGTPADKAGIKPGDEIMRVNGTPARSLSLDEVERLIRGPVGTPVVLLIHERATRKTRSVTVTRGHIFVPSVHAKMEDGYDYVRLSDFGQTSYVEVRKALLEGKSHRARGYILDLRNNGGGLLDAAVDISSLFIPQGTIVSTIDRDGLRDSRSATNVSIGVAPLVVLVNKYTASASEITAGAIQDYRVGTLIGTRTFGKGVVQSIYDLGPDQGALKITTARYVTPLGRDIHHKGIEPDLRIQQAIEPYVIDTPKDLQLLAAKDYLRRVARR